MDTNTPVRVVAGPRRGSRGVVVEVRPQAALGMTVGVRVDGVVLFYKPDELEPIESETTDEDHS